jgi:hypothetical protein
LEQALMFISKFKQWLDEVDPYALQRITLYKGLCIATIGVYIYWIFQPANLLAFISPFFLVSLYEAPVLSSFKEKEQLLIFSGIAVILISVSFYLVYPFKGVFFFYSVLVLAITYFCVLNYFYALKNLTMLLLATGVIILNTNPPANLQVAYGLLSSTALAMTMALICLRFFPNLYLIVWNRALQKFIECLELDIECAISQKQESPTGEEILHLGMVRNYRRMIPKKYMMQAYRISVNIRNIQYALDNLYYESKNELFWYGVKRNLHWLRIKMKTYIPCDLPNMPIEPDTQLQHYVVHCLQQAFIRWNKLCSLRQH